MVRQSDVVVFVHLVWGTWDQLPLLKGEVERQVYRAMQAKCIQLKAEVVAMGGVEDHVHVLVRRPATLSIADLAKHLKGASSHLITHAVAPDEFFKWQGSYGAFSVSLSNVTAVHDCIRRQKEHHQMRTLITEWEPPVSPVTPAP